MLIISGKHICVLNTKGMKLPYRFCSFGTKSVLKINASDEHAVNGYIEVCAFCVLKAYFKATKKLFIAAGNLFSFGNYSNAFACRFGNVLRHGNFNTAGFCTFNNAFCHRVVRKSFGGTCKSKYLVFGKTGIKLYFRNLKFSGSKSAGFVKNGILYR